MKIEIENKMKHSNKYEKREENMYLFYNLKFDDCPIECKDYLTKMIEKKRVRLNRIFITRRVVDLQQHNRRCVHMKFCVSYTRISCQMSVKNASTVEPKMLCGGDAVDKWKLYKSHK